MKIKLHTKGGILDLDAAPGERLLYAALRQGIEVPYECATGTCGTCRGRARPVEAVEDGWLEAPGGKRLRRDKGDVLLCQSHARTDCDIAVPSELKPPPAGWPKALWTKARLEAPKRLTHDVMAFSIALESPMDFIPGQFIVVEVAGVPGFRAYSMVNEDRDTRRIDLVVKKKPGGGFSDWLFSERADGADLKVFGPLGKAIFRPEEGRDVLCIAGGSGIAGMMAILARAVKLGYFKARQGDLFFGVRTMRDVFYLKELEAFLAAAPENKQNLRLTIALSDEDAPAAESAGGVRFGRGFVHQVAQAAMAGRYGNVVAFVAGPQPMVDGALKVLLAEARLPPEFIRYDKFS